MRVKVKHSLAFTISTICLLMSIVAFLNLVLPDIHGPAVPAGMLFILLCGSSALVLLPHALIIVPKGFACTPQDWLEARDLAMSNAVRFLHIRQADDGDHSGAIVCLRTRTNREFTLHIPVSHYDYPLMQDLCNGDEIIGRMDTSRSAPCATSAELLRFQRA